MNFNDEVLDIMKDLDEIRQRISRLSVIGGFALKPELNPILTQIYNGVNTQKILLIGVQVIQDEYERNRIKNMQDAGITAIHQIAFNDVMPLGTPVEDMF